MYYHDIYSGQAIPCYIQREIQSITFSLLGTLFQRLNSFSMKDREVFVLAARIISQVITVSR